MPHVDMFASRLNKQINRFVSWKPDPDAEAIDAFSVSCKRKYIYAFPRFSLMGRVLQKARQDQADVLLVAPFWVTQNFYTTTLEMLTDDPFIIKEDQNTLKLPLTSSCEQTTSNALSYIRKSFKSRKLSEKSVDIIMSSWRQSTKKQYSTYINRWISFCNERKIDTFQTPIEYFVEFLIELYKSGLSYGTLNSARSALSNLCNKQDGYSVGSHPLVIRFMTGGFNLRPTEQVF